MEYAWMQQGKQWKKYWCQPSRITASAPNAARLPTVMKKRPIQREMRRRLARGIIGQTAAAFGGVNTAILVAKEHPASQIGTGHGNAQRQEKE